MALFSRKAQKDTEIPFSNEVPITSPEKTPKFRFQIEDIGIIFQMFPSQAQKKGKSRFQIEDIGIIFQKSPKRHGNLFSNEVPITSPEKTTEIPFSNRRYWHYFPEVPITSPKKGKSRFQIEDIGIIFQKSSKRHGNPVRFQMRFPSQAQKKHGDSVFK